ncbi:ABC transporter permease [Alkalibacter sp. M17DMB]|nr:ABC transporter permease [Alkalibacter mobilis]
MKRKAFFKNLFKSIINTRGRFFSLMAIIFLGVSFFAGINATEPDMILSADKYYKEQNLSDYRLISPLGFKYEDRKNIEEVSDVEKVQYGFYKDLFLSIPSGETSVAKILSYDPNDYKNGNGINIPYLMEGRMPTDHGEIALERSMYGFGSDNLSLGDEVALTLPEGEVIGEYLESAKYEIVGFISTPLYITFERGQTNIGDGSIDFIGYVLKNEFQMKDYNEAYIKIKNSENYIAYTPEYEDLVERPIETFEKLGVTAMARETQIYRDELEESRNLFLEEKSEAESKLVDAENQLQEAERKIIDGEEELKRTEERYKLEIEAGESQLDVAGLQLEAAKIKYFDGYLQWLEGYNEYQDGRMDLIEAKYRLDDGKIRIDDAQSDLDQARVQLEATKTTIDALKGIRDGLPAEDELPTQEEYEQMLIDIENTSPELAETLRPALESSNPENINTIRKSLDEGIAAMEEDYQEGVKQLEEGEKQLAESKIQYEEGMRQYELGMAELEIAKSKIDSSKAELVQGRLQLEQGEQDLAQGRKELEEAREKLNTSLNDGYADLEEARRKLEEGRIEFEIEKKSALDKIADAEIKIKDAERKLLELPKEWFVYTRNGNPGYSGYGNDAERIGAVAKVFPLFFFLVAALVCLTTMTRMVDEERVQIGTLKALGYGTLIITSKYLVYSILASVTGAAIGFLLGFQLFPRLIMTVYRGMYDIPYMLSPFHVDYALISLIIAVATTTVAALGASLSTLKSTPATLMQPKAPKPGKRIFMERIGFLWNRMNFIQKVTARNIFRYKRRFLMTVIGIAGCSALLLTGYGIRDSVNAISDLQFEEVFLYDGVVVKDVENTEGASLQDVLGDNPDIEGYSEIYLETISVYSEKGGREFETSLYVPSETNEFARFFDLHDRRTKEKFDLNTQGAIITEKLAGLLGVEPGDTIQYRDTDNVTYSFTIAAIAENYLGHNLFMSKEYFDAVTLKSPNYNGGIFNLKDSTAFNEESFKEEILEQEGVLAVSLTESFRNEFYDTMKSLDYVVLILILSAGALAFVVLYNLTNINITERIREIATIKVLGFRAREVSAYVYRENLILSFIGTIAGLGLGFVLHKFVMDTMEVDNMMFGKEIGALSFLYSIVLTMVFAVLVNVLMYYKLKNVNMVESLKSVE